MKQEPDAMKQDQQGLTNRRNFLISSAAAAGLVLSPETLLFGQSAGGPTASASSISPSTAPQNPAANAAPSKLRPDPLKPELVKEFVMAAHVDLDKTKAMLAEM